MATSSAASTSSLASRSAIFGPTVTAAAICSASRPRERLQPEPPPRDPEPVLARERAQPLEERHRLLVGDEVRVDRAVDAKLGEPQDRPARVGLLKERDELVP